jgi:N-acetylneuraminic acid mutarotase
MVYVICGRSEQHAVTNTILRYDPALNSWTDIPTPLTPRVHATATSLNDCIYTGLGFASKGIYTDDSYLRDFYRYEPATNTWTKLADYPSDKTVAAVSFSDGTYIYVGFGYHGFSHELFRYDPEADTWKQVAASLKDSDFPPRVMSPVAGAVGGRCFVGTGFRNHVSSFWAEYIPANDKWEERTAVPGKSRHNAACTATDDKLFIFGGWHYGDSLTNGFHYEDILCYTPADDKWSSYGSMPDGPSESRIAVRINNTVFFGLGEDKSGHLLTNLYRFEVQ